MDVGGGGEVVFVPVDGESDGGCEVEAGLPAETQTGFADVEHQELGFMEGMGVGDIAECAASVAVDHFGGNVPYGGDALEIGPEVPPFAVADGVVPHFLSK